MRLEETTRKAAETLKPRFDEKTKIRNKYGNDFKTIEGCLKVLNRIRGNPNSLEFFTVDEQYHKLLDKIIDPKTKEQYEIIYQRIVYGQGTKKINNNIKL